MALTVHSWAEDLMGDGRFATVPEEPPAPARAPGLDLPTFDPLEVEPMPAPTQAAASDRAPRPLTQPPVSDAPMPRPSSPGVLAVGSAPMHSASAGLPPVGSAPVKRPSSPGMQPVGAARAAPAPARVLIYGWGAEASAGLVRVLQAASIPATVATTQQVLSAGEGAVVLSPLPSLEALGARARAQLLVAGKAPERDLPRAQALGARGFLAAPLDADLLLRAVRRLLRPPEALPRAC
jgi:hypothetical protein